jgi:multidrug resistance efflux pump
LAALTIGDLDELHITVYVPEDRYGEIQLGDKALVSVDSFPDETFDAVVVRIADRAEFTPRNVQTEEDRRTTVYAVELLVEAPLGKLKPGMPADVVFELAE